MTVVSICSESTVVGASLSQIQGLLIQRQDLAEAWKTRTDVAMALDTALTGCMVLYSCLEREIQRITASTSSSGRLNWRVAIRTVWNESKLQELLTALRGQQTAISLLIQLLQMYSYIHYLLVILIDKPYRDTLTDIRQMLDRNQGAIGVSKNATQSLRNANPGVHAPASIYDTMDRDDQTITRDDASFMAPSEIEFEFDDMIINSQVYRRMIGHARARMELNSDTVGDLIDLSEPLPGLSVSQDAGLLPEVLQDLQDLTLQEGATRKNTQDTVQETSNTQQPVRPDDNIVSEPEEIQQTAGITPANDYDMAKSEPTDQPPKKSPKICFKCHEVLTGQFVKAPAPWHNTLQNDSSDRKFHLECFTCAVSSLDYYHRKAANSSFRTAMLGSVRSSSHSLRP